MREGLTKDLKELKLNWIKRLISEQKKEMKIKQLAEKYMMPVWEVIVELEGTRV